MATFVEIGSSEGHFLRFQRTEELAAVMSFAAPLGFSGSATVGLRIPELAAKLAHAVPTLSSFTASLGTDCELTIGVAIDRLGHAVVSVHYLEWTPLGELETRFAFATDQTFLQEALAQARRWND